MSVTKLGRTSDLLIFGDDNRVSRWVGEHVQPRITEFGLCVTIGVATAENVLMAGVVYNNYRHPNIEVTFAVEDNHWASREAISCILRYPFVQLGCLRITAFTAAGNDRARAFLTSKLIGFKQEGYHPNGFATDDAVSYGLLRRDCRWVKPEEYEVRAASPDTD